ncbi:MAG: hypothetical protein ACQEP1_01830 [Nanobdellota archaeon]
MVKEDLNRIHNPSFNHSLDHHIEKGITNVQNYVKGFYKSLFNRNDSEENPANKDLSKVYKPLFNCNWNHYMEEGITSLSYYTDLVKSMGNTPEFEKFGMINREEDSLLIVKREYCPSDKNNNMSLEQGSWRYHCLRVKEPHAETDDKPTIFSEDRLKVYKNNEYKQKNNR